MADDVEVDLDSVITRLLEGIASYSSPHTPLYSPFLSPPARGTRTIKTVQLAENEVKGLCMKAREIFLSQPILLELEAPLKICGENYTLAADWNVRVFALGDTQLIYTPFFPAFSCVWGICGWPNVRVCVYIQLGDGCVLYLRLPV